MKKSIFFLFVITPFLTFIITYFLLSEYFYREKKINVINLTGKTLNEIVPWINKTGISIKIEDFIINNNNKDGFIIEQFPKPNTKISYQSSIYLKITINENKNIENIIGLNINDAENILNSKGIIFKKIKINSFYPKDTIYAFGWSKKNKEAILYLSDGIKKEKILKNIKGIYCQSLKENLKNIEIICINKENKFINTEHNEIINYFKPSSGSIIKDKIFIWH
jgi:beta-lactam-binding protein with PASTA domain